jgi:hypothetical protein
MVDSVDKAFVQQFNDNLILLAEQKESRLRDTVTFKPLVGTSAYFERLGGVAMEPILSRYQPTQYSDIEHSRRRVDANGFAVTLPLDPQDDVRMLIDPKNAYCQRMASAFGRKIDDVIIAAATGTAVTVTSSLAGTTGTASFAAGNIVDDDFSVTDSNLSIEKVIEAKRLLKKNEVNMDQPMVLVLNASAEAALLNTVKATSRDYGVTRLDTGEVSLLLGFRVIRSERILGTANGTDADPVLCLAYSRDAIGLAMNMDLRTKIGENPERRYVWQAHMEASLGAVRIQEEPIVSIQCVQAS